MTGRLLRGGLRQIGGQFAGSFLWLAAMPLLARHLGPAGLGQYIIISTVVGLIALITDGGLPMYAQRVLSGAAGSIRTALLEHVWRLRWLTSIAAVLAVLPLLWLAPSELRPGFLVSLLGLPALLSVYQSIAHLNAVPDPPRAARVEFSLRAFSFVAIVTAVIADLGLVAVLAFVSLAQLSAAIVGFRLASATERPKTPMSPKGVDWSTLRRSLPLGLIPLLTVALNRGDILILAAFRGDIEVGIYGATYRGIEVLAGFAYLSGSLMLTLGAKASHDRRRLARDLGIGVVASTTFIVVGVLVGFAPELLKLAGGTPFLTEVSTPFGLVSPSIGLTLLLGSLALMGYRLIDTALLVAWDQQRLVFKVFGYAIAVNLVMVFALTPSFGLIGAAAATLVSEAAAAVISSRYIRRLAGPLLERNILAKGILVGALSGAIGFATVGLPLSWSILAVLTTAVLAIVGTRWLRAIASGVDRLQSLSLSDRNLGDNNAR